MTAKEYEDHKSFLAARDAIVERDRTLPPTHRTIRKTWHACDIPEGSPLIFSQDLQNLFDAREKARGRAPQTEGNWFVQPNGLICHLWKSEFSNIRVHS